MNKQKKDAHSKVNVSNSIYTRETGKSQLCPNCRTIYRMFGNTIPCGCKTHIHPFEYYSKGAITTEEIEEKQHQARLRRLQDKIDVNLMETMYD